MSDDEPGGVPKLATASRPPINCRCTREKLARTTFFASLVIRNVPPTRGAISTLFCTAKSRRRSKRSTKSVRRPSVAVSRGIGRQVS